MERAKKRRRYPLWLRIALVTLPHAAMGVDDTIDPEVAARKRIDPVGAQEDLPSLTRRHARGCAPQERRRPGRWRGCW